MYTVSEIHYSVPNFHINYIYHYLHLFPVEKPFNFKLLLLLVLTTYVWSCEETFGSTLVGFSESSQLPQTERFAIQSPATAF